MAFRLILSILLFSGVSFAADDISSSKKIGVINIQRALSLSKVGKKAQKNYENEVKGLQKKLNVKKEAYEKKKVELKNKQNSLSKKALRGKIDELKQVEKDLKRTFQDSEEELRSKSKELMGDLVGKLRKVIVEYGKENGYVVILDANSPSVLYFDNAIDVTKEITKRFDSK